MSKNLIKYPKTLHLPFSDGISNDDKVIHELSVFDDKVIAMLEKMDGECTTMYRNHIHARSLDTPSHESRNWVRGLWGNISYLIPDGWRVCGENMFAEHSIHYSNLESYFLVFSVWNENNECLSLSETLDFCKKLGLSHVPILFMLKFDVDEILKLTQKMDFEKQEGYVIRNVDSFHFSDFNKNVAKFVRKNHVQTDEHWFNKKIIKNELKG